MHIHSYTSLYILYIHVPGLVSNTLLQDDTTLMVTSPASLPASLKKQFTLSSRKLPSLVVGSPNNRIQMTHDIYSP